MVETTSAPGGHRVGVASVRRLAASWAVVVLMAGVGHGQAVEYPEIYRAQKLPELPGATLVSSGRQQTSLRDGLRLRLTSSMTLDEVRAFYREALEAGGWAEQQSPASRAANQLAGMLSFAKGNLTYAVVITAPPGSETQVMVNVVER